MRKSMLDATLALAAEEYGPWGILVNQCSEVGVIVPSQLRKALDEAGLVVTYHSGPGPDAEEGEHPHGAWVLVRKPSSTQGIESKSSFSSDNPDEIVIVARAYSSDETDALLQAVAAEVRAEAAPYVQDEAKVALAEQVKAALASSNPTKVLELLGIES